MSQFEKLQKAAALKYSEDSPDSAPVVVASGMGPAAQQIVSIAEKNGVPVFRDNSLATLLSQMETGTEIPPELYRAVVDIYVYFLGFTADKDGNVKRPERPAPAEPKSAGPAGPKEEEKQTEP
ncbi:MAG: EscU/YscU/HrcU family type III secretion system export apparatus switch protein [Oscillospiraceae bacterium]|jgi:flagellar biosynthesis protein|nr:EscU/YscU/HrcU family type III secretion system export apparatus switch protein [Oscillospiraceae bacterium]